MSQDPAPAGFFAAGSDPETVDRELNAARAGDARWSDPRNLRASYFAGDDVVRVATQAFTRYLGTNAVYGAVAYPSLRRFESEVLEILLRLFRAPSGAAGTITTGGTESIFMAVKTARDWARANRPAVVTPTLVVPRSAHAAFDKAAHLLGLRVRRMESSPDFKADVAGMARAIDRDTIMVVGSAPAYAYGVVDQLPEIAALAERHGLWMHLDACVGGMVLPFARDLGYPLPTFDFSLSPLTSVSIDLHKYGYAFHGCSALLLREEALSAHQRYQFDRWPAGSYSTNGFIASRGGGPIASAWAVMKLLGYEGYRDRVVALYQAKDRVREGIERIEGLRVFGDPDGPLLGFGSDSLDVVALGQEMNRRGWSFARLVEPPGMLLLFNGFHGAIVEPFLADLASAAEAVRAGRVSATAAPAVYTV
jgi:glutamate/tyrosine decarboxylase-like PLP-dependent enzyme